MDFIFYFKNGSKLKSDENVHKAVYSNPDLVTVEIIMDNYTVKIDLNGSRFVFFKEDGNYFVGKQGNKGKINHESIIKLNKEGILLR